MRTRAARGFTISIGSYAILHFLLFFYHIETIRTALSLLGFFSIVFAFIYLKRTQLFVPIFLIIMSFVIDLISGSSIVHETSNGLLQMRSLVGLLFVVPMIGWVLKEEPYIDHIMFAARHLFRTSRRFYFGMMLMTQIIAYFLLFGSLPVIYQIVNDFLKEKRGEAWEYFKGTALLRAFALSTLWVVSIPSFIYAVDSLKASLWLSILQGFFVSMCAVVLAVFMSNLRERQYDVDLTRGLQEVIANMQFRTEPGKNAGREVWEFLFLFVSLFGTIFLIHGIWGGSLLIVIPLVIVIWTLFYYAVKRRFGRFTKRIKYYFTDEAQGNSQQFLLLLSAGLLINSLNHSGVGQAIMNGIFYIADKVPFLNVLWLLPFVLIFLGFAGLGPLTVMVLVGGVLQGVSIPYPPELVVISLTSGSVISILLSPFILPVIIMSGTNGLSVFKNGFKFNFIYALAFYLLVQAYIQITLSFLKL